jgi:hypothetical protein
MRVGEENDIAAGLRRAEVTRGGDSEVIRSDQPNRGISVSQKVRAFVVRTVIDNEDFAVAVECGLKILYRAAKI